MKIILPFAERQQLGIEKNNGFLVTNIMEIYRRTKLIVF